MSPVGVIAPQLTSVKDRSDGAIRLNSKPRQAPWLVWLLEMGKISSFPFHGDIFQN